MPDSTPTRRAYAVGALFFVNGMTFSNWLPRIPEVRDKLHISNGTLGTTLIGMGLGGFVGSLLVGKAMSRLGSRRLLLIAATMLALFLPLIAVAPNAASLGLVLFALGCADVFNDMAMNAQGVMAQQDLGRSIMNRLHGTWSLGFTCGAGIGLIASATHLAIGPHLAGITVVLLIAILLVRNELDPNDREAAPAAAGSRRSLGLVILAIGAMAFAISPMESVPTDWSAVLLRDVFHAGRIAGTGTVVFAATMMIGRLVGDHVLERVGPDRLLTGAMTIWAIGMLIVVTAPTGVVAVIGYAVAGLGVSVIFPQLYARAATLPGVSAGAGLGAMGFGQRLGFLAAPLLVGNLADAHGLRVAIASVAVGCLIVVGTARRYTHPSPGAAAEIA